MTTNLNINGISEIDVTVTGGASSATVSGDVIALTLTPSPGSILLETNGTPNGDQTTLNLTAGTNITLTDSGSGTVTIDATGGGGGSVTNVTATAPLTSSGGATPNISASYHGNSTKIQLSDNTGTSGNVAKFDANGNVTDGGVAASAIVTNVTGTAPVVSSGGATPAISVTSHGNVARVQLSDNTGTSAHYAAFDANGNVTDGGAKIAFQTGGTPNGSQVLLNLAAGSNVTLTDNGSGTVTVTAAGSSTPAQVFTETKTNFASAATRAIATTKNIYQNTTGAPLLVLICGDTGTTANDAWTAFCDSGATPTTVVANITGCNNANANQNAISLAFFVPINFFYAVTIASGTAVLRSWREFQMTSTLTDSGNLSGSRVIGTAYQNTSGKVRWILARVGSVNAASSVQGLSDTSNPPTSVVEDATHTASTAQTVTLLFPVPNNHYYKITAASGSLTTWNEWDWNVSGCTKSGNLSVTGASAYRSVNSVSVTVNTGIGTATAVMPQTFMNDSGNGRWVTCGSSNSAAQSSMNMWMNEGVPPFLMPVSPQPLTGRCNQNTSVARRVFTPVMPLKFYSAQDTTAGTLTNNWWWEYDFTP